ncbi:MAG: hypothetical protein PHE55_22130 [Methylococcaceae bacterium]|nr:hypothetical protein [Methylococcaceae bacterium]
MVHYSDKDLGFILDALSIAEQHPEILTPSFTIDEMRRDVDALQKLDVIIHAMTRLLGKCEDSHFAAASESQDHGHSIYPFVKIHNNLTGGLEDALAELAKHFSHSKPAKPPSP